MTQSRLPSSASSDEELPLYDSGLWPSQSKHRRTSLFRVVALCPNTIFFGFAALTGVLLFVIFTLFPVWWSSGRGLGSPEFHSSSLAPELPTSPTSAPSPGTIISTESLLSPPSEIASNLIDYHHLEIEKLRDLVGKAKGFYGRDYSLWLGWNNMRYIIDAAFLQAQLLNRTLILPSFVYARACEYDLDVCADYADMVNKGKAMNDAQWDDRPIEEQMGYRIPLPLMLNITRMRSVHPVILVSDYLRLHGLPGDIESGRGSWEREKYHTHANIFSSDSHRLPSLFVVKNGRYDSGGTVRVDALPQKMKERGNYEGSGVDGHWPEVKETAVSATLREALPRNGVLDWHTALDLLRRTEAKDSLDLEKEEQIEAALLDNGWEVLYTFDSIQGRDLTKTVVNPIRQVAPRSSIHGWKDDYGEVDADVLVLEGETHLWRKAGAMQFTTAAARKEFQRTVLYTLVRNDAFQDLGQVLASRMSERTGGRLWVGAHLRRGDFAELGWTFSTTLEDHVNRIKKEIDGGRQLLQEISNVELYEIPDVQPDNSIVTRGKPLKTDPFYVATDERSPEGIQYLRSQGAVLLSDLLNQEDRRALGWPLMLTDVRALMEQELLSHSAYFVGTSISSVSGGIINMRAVYGADRRTIHMD